MPRGILATCSAPLRDGVTAEDLQHAYAKAYADEPFVHLLPAGPVAADQVGDRLQRRAPPGDRRRVRRDRMVAVGARRQPAKGTAGAAVQCMNLALGLEETTGLATIGLAP